MNRISRIFQPLTIVPKNATIVKKVEISSKSQKLMSELGLIRPAHNGTYYILPVLQRSVEKFTRVVEESMGKLCAQKMSLPILTSSELWAKSGRLTNIGREVMTSIDRHDHIQILSPTNEESITALIAFLSPISYKQLPLRLYQVGVKFRDEMKPRFGLIRAKEFTMKDLYTFDVEEQTALMTYQQVNEAYSNIFSSLKLDYLKVQASTGEIGGSLSHEFHLPAEIGDDTLIRCNKCGFASNKEIVEEGKESVCKECESKDVGKTMGIEVGHTFLLGDRYTKALNATVILDDGTVQPMCMGCYGIGITRTVAAAIEVLSSDTEIRWPSKIAPYLVCIIAPKSGSKEESEGKEVLSKIYYELDEREKFKGNVLVDDRKQLTIGKRLMMAKRMGFPVIVVIGGKILNEEPMIEVHITKNGKEFEVRPTDVLQQLDQIDLD